MKSKVTSEMIQLIIKDYNNKKMIKDIAAKFNLNTKYVSILLKKHCESYVSQKKSNDFWNEIVEEFKKGKTAGELSIKFKVSSNQIRTKVRNSGLSLRKIDNRKSDKTLNEDYFENIDSEAKAYLVGFIMADGNVNKTCDHQSRTNRLSMQISNKDICILNLLKNELNTQAEIITFTPKGTYSTNLMSKIRINSQKMCADLSKYGIVPRKTGKEIFPEDAIPKDMIRHFIRGFLDGDGSIMKRKTYGHTISFCSNKIMLLSLSKYLKRTLNLNGNLTVCKDKRHENVYGMGIYSKDDVAKTIDFLYKDANYYLDRKYSIYKNKRN